jgi:hypothetical protein
VHVQFWVCALGTAGAPHLASAGGTAGLIRPPDDAGENLAVSPQAELVVDVPWTPLASDITWAQPGVDVHVCMLANVFATDGTNDGAPVALSSQLSPWSNPQHAQLNMTLIAAPTNNKIAFPIFAGNPFGEGEAEFQLELKEQRRPRIGVAERAQLAAFGIKGSDEGLVRIAGRERVGVRLADGPLEDVEIALGERSGPKLRPTLAAGCPELLQFAAQLPDEPDVLRVFDISQSTADGELVGGVRVLVLSAADEPREDDGSGYGR